MYSIRITSVSLLLVLFLFVSAFTISATDVRDMDNYMSSDANDLSHLSSDIKISTTEDDLSKASMRGVDASSVEFLGEGQSVSNGGDDSLNIDANDTIKDKSPIIDDAPASLDMDDIIIQGNDGNYSIDFSQVININKISENVYELKTFDNQTYSLCTLKVSDYDSFMNAVNYINVNMKQIANPYDVVIIDFMDNLQISLPSKAYGSAGDYIFDTACLKNLIIRGYGSTLFIPNPSDSDEYRLFRVDPLTSLNIKDLNIQGFNTAISNYGNCHFTDVAFIGNRIDYIFEKDYGGAIRNYGILKCIDCTFKDNYAKYGGAVYNDLGSQSTFMDCTFSGNKAYGSSDLFSLRTHDNNNIYSCNGASCIVLDDIGEICIVNIENYKQFLNFMEYYAHERKVMKCLYVNFTKGSYIVDFKAVQDATERINGYRAYQDDLDPLVVPYKYLVNLPNAETIIINGNGAQISLLNADINDEYFFMNVNPGCNCLIKNLTITNFNRAIRNLGSLTIEDSSFLDNKCDYIIEKDYGAAIFNEGFLQLSNSYFANGYAKYGAAIYNKNGIVSCIGTSFYGNKAYGEGGAIYNEKGLVCCKGCNFTCNQAKKGGDIYNYYGLVNLDDDWFSMSSANEGISIYNDFGNLTVNNSNFENSYSVKGKEIMNYGDDDTHSLVVNSYGIYPTQGSIFQEIFNGQVLNETISIGYDGPNEGLRWGVRVAEIGVCLAICIGSIITGLGPLASFFVCTLGGGVLAAAEEAFEEVYIDHNFNIYNCMVMSIIAGVFDGIAGAIGSKITSAFLEGAKNKAIKVALLEIVLDGIGEILTEVLPRFDFTSFTLPNTIVDLCDKINNADYGFFGGNVTVLPMDLDQDPIKGPRINEDNLYTDVNACPVSNDNSLFKQLQMTLSIIDTIYKDIFFSLS